MSVISSNLAIQSRHYWQQSQIANSTDDNGCKILAERELGIIAEYAGSRTLRSAAVDNLLTLNQGVK